MLFLLKRHTQTWLKPLPKVASEPFEPPRSLDLMGLHAIFENIAHLLIGLFAQCSRSRCFCPRISKEKESSWSTHCSRGRRNGVRRASHIRLSLWVELTHCIPLAMLRVLTLVQTSPMSWRLPQMTSEWPIFRCSSRFICWLC